MATIKKRGPYQWQAKVRKKGVQASKTFTTKGDAENWVAIIESEIARGVFVDRSLSERVTLDEVIDRYMADELPSHKGAESERLRLNAFKRSQAQLLDRPMATLRVRDFENYRDERLKKVKPGTIKRDLGLLQIAIEYSARDIGLLENPIKPVKRPRVNDTRDVRLSHGDENKLISQAEQQSNPWIKPSIILAIETAMRRGELLELMWENINKNKTVAHLPDTKTGVKRNVPLSPRAREVLAGLPQAISGRVIPISPNSLKKGYERCRKLANLEHIRFHDLRHEATSRLFEAGWNIMEVSAVTGHKDLQSLKRYTQLRAEDLAKKMENS